MPETPEGSVSIRVALAFRTLRNRSKRCRQGPNEKITLSSEAFQLPFVRYPPISKDLQNQADLLQNLPAA
jgi:hypothetical protein